MVMGSGSPAAKAADLDFNAVTTGPLFGLLQGVGVDSISIPNVLPPVIDTLTINLANTDANPVNLADKINAYDFGGWNILNNSFRRQPGGTLGIAILGASGFATLGAAEAYQALLSSAGGTTLPGYTPLVGPGLTSTLTGSQCTTQGTLCKPGNNVTNLALLLVNSPLTPNGGLVTRFAPLLKLFGVDPVIPVGATANSETPATKGSGGKVTMNGAVVNLGLAYNALSDFPATLNPFSLVNTGLATLLPTYLLSKGDIKGATQDDLIAALAGLALAGTNSTTYGTYLPQDLPILAPLRLPVQLINLVSNALGFPLNLGTPIADALQPALKILVNTGYTDVITPDKLNTCAKDCGGADPKTYADLGYTAYDRSFLTSGDDTTFLSQAPLTPQEWLQVPGDVIRALIGGITTEIQKIFTPGAAAIPSSVGAAPKQTPAPTATSTAPAAAEPPEAKVTANTTADDNAVKPAVAFADDTPSTPAPSTGSTKPAKAAASAGSSSGSSSAGGNSGHKSGVGGTKRSASND